MITCSKCSKDNQDHYKFCLGCGAELPRDAAPKPFSPTTPAGGMKLKGGGAPASAVSASTAISGSQSGPVSSPKPAPAPAPASAVPSPGPVASAAAPVSPAGARVAAAAPVSVAVTSQSAAAGSACPQCGHLNGPGNMFCGSCGFRLQHMSVMRPAVQVPVEAPVASSGAALKLTALRADGSEAGTFQLAGAAGTIGRETGGIFAGDSYLSPRHATFRPVGPGRVMVKDEGSLNGVYRKLQRDAPIEIKPNDVFRIGQEIIRFEPLTPLPPAPDGVERLGAPSKGYVGRIALVIGRNETGNAFPVPETGIHLGRERGDVLFPEDGYVSGLHCRLAWEGGKLFLTDLGSSNGTFVRLREEAEIRGGDVLLMGQQLFRVAL